MPWGEGEALGRGEASVWEGIPDIPRDRVGGGGAEMPGAVMDRQLREQAQTRCGVGGLDPHLRPSPPSVPWNVIFPLITCRPGKNEGVALV